MTALEPRREPLRFPNHGVAWLLLVGGGAGWFAALVLAIEKFALLTDPGYAPSCDFSPILSCGSIMTTDQAEVLGFPNPLIGIGAFPVVAATGAALLAGATFRRWYWWGLQIGVVAGLAFIVWLIAQSLYVIGALCPYCMVVWAVVIPSAWYVTLANLSAGRFGGRLRDSRAGRALVAWHLPGLVAAYAVVVALIGERFWYYWQTFL